MRSKISKPPGRASSRAERPALEWHCPTCYAAGSFDRLPQASTAEMLDYATAQHAVVQPRCRGRPQLRRALP